jgi:D-methionine transport system permease protein
MEFGKIMTLLGSGTLETLTMTALSTIFALLIGFPLGVLLLVTAPDGLMPKPALNQVMGRIVNVGRSFPFIILIIVLIPVTKFIVGTPVGTIAAVVPLSIAAAPYIARITESALKEVDPGMIQAARVMGSTNFTIVRKVIVPEAMPAVVAGITLMIINIIGYSAMAGAVGGGGLGAVAINYGYVRYHIDVLIGAVIIIILIVELVQMAGTRIANNMMKRR